MGIADLRESLYELTCHTRRMSERALLPLCEQMGLTANELRILLEMGRRPSHTVGTLSEAVGILRGNISAVCKALENEGLLQRARSKSDGRVVTLSLTERGAQVFERAQEQLSQYYQRFLDAQSPETLEAMTIALAPMQRMLRWLEDSDPLPSGFPEGR